jgi:N-succinyldiaminopimelate aminotransferase
VAAGFEVVVPRGTYFVVADGAPLGFDDGVELCRRLPDLAGVVGVPVSAFCRAPGAPSDVPDGPTTARALASRVRFTFVKREDVLRDAVARLGALRVGR